MAYRSPNIISKVTAAFGYPGSDGAEARPWVISSKHVPIFSSYYDLVADRAQELDLH